MLNPTFRDQRLIVEHIPPTAWYKRSTYRLMRSLHWGNTTVPVGFESDGASIPIFLWVLFSPMGTYAKAAFLHDYLLVTFWDKGYGWMTRAECDRQFYEAMAHIGVPKWRREAMYGAVRLFAILFRGK